MDNLKAQAREMVSEATDTKDLYHTLIAIEELIEDFNRKENDEPFNIDIGNLLDLSGLPIYADEDLMGKSGFDGAYSWDEEYILFSEGNEDTFGWELIERGEK